MLENRSVRTTFVVPDLGAGGAERHLATLTARLDRALFETRVVCIGREGELFADVAASVPTRALGHGKRQALRTVVALALEFRRTKPDMVVLRGYNAELLGRVAAVLARVPTCVVWVHNCGDLEPRSRVRTVSDRVLEPATDRYFGVAQQQTAYIVDDLGHPERKVRIIHNGVDPTEFDRSEDVAARHEARHELGFAAGDVVIGVLAALRPEKDHELFLEAARLVAAEVPPARFLIVGDGARRAMLESRAAELGLGGRVVFTGFRADVPRLLQVIDIFVLCSYTIECFPMALLEAMAASRPAVCTAVGGVPEMIDEGVTGFLVPPKDAVTLADRLLRLTGDPNLRGAFGRAARERVENLFTLDRSVSGAGQALLEAVGCAQDGLAAPSRPPDARADRPTCARPVRLTVVMDETAVGGVEIVTLKMFQAFDPGVVVPRLVCLRAEGPLAEDFRVAGFEVEVLDRSSWRDVRTLPRLVRSLRRSGCDAVLMAHHHRAALVLGRVAAALAGTRVTLVAAHGMDLVALGGRCLPRSTVSSLRLVSALVLLAPSQGDYLHEQEGVGRHAWSRTREVVIPNGVALQARPGPEERLRARAALGIPDDAYVLGIVARLSEEKAHHVLLDAVARLRRTHPMTWLVVVGGGSRDAELRKLADGLGIADQVLFTGVRRDVPQLLPAFDVSCLSSVHEAAPITVIESMAAGIPVVATECGALRDMIVPAIEGELVPVGDSEKMAEVLGQLADDPVRRTAMGAAARRRAESEFGIEHTARGYEALLVELMADR